MPRDDYAIVDDTLILIISLFFSILIASSPALRRAMLFAAAAGASAFSTPFCQRHFDIDAFRASAAGSMMPIIFADASRHYFHFRHFH
jgi:hypothetical protein